MWPVLPEVEAPGHSDISSVRTLQPTKEDPHPALASGIRRSLIAWLLVATLLPALVYEPAVIYAGTIYNPLLVAVVGGISIMVVSIIDYFAVKKVFELPGVASIKKTGFYRMTVRWFRWRPWETIAVFAFAPLPYDLVRVLAPSTNYPLGKYVTANVTGRVFLYYLLALGGAWLPIPLTYLIPIVLFITLMPLLYIPLAQRLSGRKRR